jgi:hypothetical protein
MEEGEGPEPPEDEDREESFRRRDVDEEEDGMA